MSTKGPLARPLYKLSIRGLLARSLQGTSWQDLNEKWQEGCASDRKMSTAIWRGPKWREGCASDRKIRTTPQRERSERPRWREGCTRGLRGHPSVKNGRRRSVCAATVSKNVARGWDHLTPGLNTYRKNPSVWPHCLGKKRDFHSSFTNCQEGKSHEKSRFLDGQTIIKLIISQWQLVMFIDFPWLVPPCSDLWPIGSAEVSALRALLGGRPIWSNRAQGIADSHKSSQPINRRTWFEVDFGLSMLCVFFFPVELLMECFMESEWWWRTVDDDCGEISSCWWYLVPGEMIGQLPVRPGPHEVHGVNCQWFFRVAKIHELSVANWPAKCKP